MKADVTHARRYLFQLLMPRLSSRDPRAMRYHQGSFLMEWLKGDTYIFIADTILMHPANPELETKSILDIKDANGKAFMREFVETAKAKGSGWVDYMWPKGELARAIYKPASTFSQSNFVVLGFDLTP